MLKVQEIREIIKLIDQSSITEFKYKADGTTVELKKTNGVTVTTAPVQQVAEVVAEPQVQAVQAPAPEVKEEVKQEEVKQEEVNTAEVSSADYDFEVESPMVGTFYAAPSPEDAPYVSVGSEVGPESIVCIVEAMKLFNEIEAEVNGVITEILVQDGELVEYGQPLFRVKKK